MSQSGKRWKLDISIFYLEISKWKAALINIVFLCNHHHWVHLQLRHHHWQELLLLHFLDQGGSLHDELYFAGYLKPETF
jgi:hypothetical protein